MNSVRADLLPGGQIEQVAVPVFVEVRRSNDERVAGRMIERQPERDFARGAEVLDGRGLRTGVVDLDGDESHLRAAVRFLTGTVARLVSVTTRALEAACSSGCEVTGSFLW